MWQRQSSPVFLPGKIPWTEEPGGLQAMELRRVGHDWATKLVPTPTWLTATLQNSSRTWKHLAVNPQVYHQLSQPLSFSRGLCVISMPLPGPPNILWITNPLRSQCLWKPSSLGSSHLKLPEAGILHLKTATIHGQISSLSPTDQFDIIPVNGFFGIFFINHRFAPELPCLRAQKTLCKAQERGDVCILKADSHFCMAETNTTL